MIIYRDFAYESLRDLWQSQSAGTSGDHGGSFLRLSRLPDGITDNNQFRYLPGLRPLTLAVCTMESQPALTSAPTSVKLNREFFLQITKGRIEFSTVLLSMSQFPSSRKVFALVSRSSLHFALRICHEISCLFGRMI